MLLCQGHIIRVLMFRIYRGLKFNNNWMEGLKQTFLKGDSVMANKHVRSFNILTHRGSADLKDHEKHRNGQGNGHSLMPLHLAFTIKQNHTWSGGAFLSFQLSERLRRKQMASPRSAWATQWDSDSKWKIEKQSGDIAQWWSTNMWKGLSSIPRPANQLDEWVSKWMNE